MAVQIPLIPEMEVGLEVVTPTAYNNITAHKKYRVEELREGEVVIRNDINKLVSHSAYQFIEADLYFTMCLFSTAIKLFSLGHKAL